MILYAQIRRYSGSAVLPAGPLSASAVSFFAFRIRAERKCMKIRSELEQAFAADCTFIRMAREYADYFDDIKCVILTDLSEAEVKRKYEKLLRQCYPYVVAPAALKAVMRDYTRNEDKHEKREARNTGLFGYDEEAEKMHSELTIPSFEEIFFQNEAKRQCRERVRTVLAKLPKTQQRRLVKSCVQKKTWTEIACEEGRTERAVYRSVQTAKKNFRNIWLNEYSDTDLPFRVKERIASESDKTIRSSEKERCAGL